MSIDRVNNSLEWRWDSAIARAQFNPTVCDECSYERTSGAGAALPLLQVECNGKLLISFAEKEWKSNLKIAKVRFPRWLAGFTLFPCTPSCVA